MSQKKQEPKESFSELKSRFNQAGDYNLALSLQEQEFSQHYGANRSARRTSVEDHKLSSEEQAKERQTALAVHLNEMNKIVQDDEQLALELQRQFEEEYRQQREALFNADAELAQRLATEFGSDRLPSELPSTSNQQRAEAIRANYENEDLESLFQPRSQQAELRFANNSLTTAQSAQMPSWSSNNPFLQDLIDFREQSGSDAREQSADK
ncbi:CCDC50-N domain-containing protein [Aphelenchoides bicaudatus]|nr:CCDC50-N domain-containing protein [Aphelenchoides bicaudatus]